VVFTRAAESALLDAPVLTDALEAGRFDARQLSAYESSFRAYFDPAMIFLDFCAAVLRNRHLARPWLKALARGCELAQGDAEFARVGGSYFGGLDVRPFGILGQMWVRIVQDLVLAWPRLVGGLALGRGSHEATVGDLVEWQAAWSRSLVSDPLWHMRWTMDVQRKSVRLISTMESGGRDPRAAGLVPD
jgi:menaquinone-9 beta-reductase